MKKILALLLAAIMVLSLCSVSFAEEISVENAEDVWAQKWADVDTSKHVVQALILHRILYRHHILDILHYTDGLGIASRVATDGTGVSVADVMTDMAILDLLFHTMDGLSKLFHLRLFLTEHPEYKAQGCLATDTRKLRELGHGLFQ